MWKFLLFSSVALLILSCKTIEPAPPVLKQQALPVAQCPVSSIVLPVRINIEPYLKMADEQVDRSFEGMDTPCSGVSYAYHFDRDPIQFTGNGRSVLTNVNGKYRIKMSYCPECTGLFTDKPLCLVPRIPFSCGYNEPMRRIKIQFTSAFSLTSDYGLSTQTKIKDIDAIDPCEVTVFSYDATGELLKEIRKSLEKLSKDIDKETAKITFKKEAADMWKTLSEPVRVPGFGFISLQPKELSVTQPEIKGKYVTCMMQLDAVPSFSTYQLTPAVKPLPPLKLADNFQSDTLSLYSDLRLNYDSLSAIINTYASGQELILKGKKIRIDSVSIRGPQDDKLVFSMKFSGDKKGTLYLNGKPAFDPATQMLELTDVDFDLETKSLLLRTAEWLFNDRILEEVTKASKQDLSVHLTKLQTMLNKSLSFEKNGFRLSGAMHQIRVEDLHPEANDLVVRVSAKGKLLLTSIDN